MMRQVLRYGRNAGVHPSVSYKRLWHRNTTSQGDAYAYGQGLHPVLEVIAQRMKNNKHKETDNIKLGLVVEGGGMKGISSAGMLVALEALGLRDVFDSVYGSSAGAVNLTYFVANDTSGADIYTNHIANSEFISLYRLWGKQKKPALNISFLLDHVMEHIVPLDWNRVVKSDIPLKIAATSLDHSKSILLENFRDKQDLIECLRASASPPGISHGPIYHRGQALVDALIFEPVPVWSAIDDGCTHILTLCTKTKDEDEVTGASLRRFSESLVRKFVMTPKYIEKELYKIADSHSRASKTTEKMLSLGTNCPVQSSELFGAHVFAVYPKVQPVGSLCKNIAKLERAREEGYQAILSLLNHMKLHNNLKS